MVNRRAGALRVVLARAFLYGALLGVVAVSLFPIYFAFTTSLKQTRDGWTAIFGGQGASQQQVNFLLSLSRREARRIEALLHVTSGGNGSTATPATMGYEGLLTGADVQQAWAQP